MNAEPNATVARSLKSSLNGPFRQDIATFYALPHVGTVSPVSVPTVIDGADGEKVLSVACPSQNVLFAAADERRVRWTASEQGLSLHTESGTLSLTGADGLPIENLRCVAVGADGTLWAGGAEGAIRLRDGVWRYFAGRRWLPDDNVTNIALDAQGRAWITTDGGVACLQSLPMTWTEKADHYEAVTLARHNRDGYVTECLLEKPGDVDSFLYEASDNDGLWTALYLCAECFRYAVTGEAQAQSLARKSLRALLDLVRLTGIPGFPARAVMRKGARAEQSHPLANWLPSPVDPNVLYKADTSSDEMDGHYLAWYVYHSLVADDAEKAEIAAVCEAVTNHILDNDYTLVGPTGKRTSWGVWTPQTLNEDPEWRAERGLNSLEILSHLKVAQHICPCARFETAYCTLIEQHHYALNVVRQKMLPPDADFNHSDDELAACAYYPLLMLETDPDLRSLYLLSLERTQAMLRPQRSPFHNVIYSACTGRAGDSDAVWEWLADAPLDLRCWTMRNSHRADAQFQPDVDRFGKRQLTRPLPPGEIGPMKWNTNPYLADWEGEGRREMDGAFWLLPYWMGRYYQG